MKTTRYFDYTRKRQDRARIREEWIMAAIENPVQEETQSDGRMRRWTWVKEESKFLRVILLPDRETVHNAFFDRSFQLEKNEG